MANPSIGEYLEGHADFSAFLAFDPDLQIFRRFTRLTARNLLYLQSELTSLETWFDEFDKEDEQRLMVASEEEKMHIWLRNRNWETFTGMAGELNSTSIDGEERRQAVKMKQILRLRKIVGEYQDALARQHACLSLGKPEKKTLMALREWHSLKNPLLGRESEMLDDSEDLEAHGYPPSWGKLYVFRDQYVERLVAITSVSLAALLLVGSILALYFERRPGARLGLIGVFTFIFAASVGMLTSASRGDMFAATAAYAAVLVVFVSGNLGSSQIGN